MLFVVLGLLLVLGCYGGIQFLFGYQLVIDESGVTVGGAFESRQFNWDEITHFSAWRMRVYVDGPNFTIGYQAVIHVDGTNNARRLARNLFFNGHFVAPKMELRGKDLVLLLRKAKKALHVKR